jgi:hypothetical protein
MLQVKEAGWVYDDWFHVDSCKQSKENWRGFWITIRLQGSKKIHASLSYFNNLQAEHNQSMQQQTLKNTT